MKIEDLMSKYGVCPEDEDGLVIYTELYYEEDTEEPMVYFSTDNSSGAKYMIYTIEDLVESFRKYVEANM